MSTANEIVECDDNDLCPICRQLLYHPATTTACGHAACHTCLLTWIATSKSEPQPLDGSFRISSEPEIDGISFGCPLCRTETTVVLDEARSSQLESTYPILYQERAMQNTETDQLMIIQLGNTHKNVPPSISPYSGMTRTHHWTFFLKSSHTDLIDSVDLILHETFRNHRFVTLREPPFTKSSLGWGYFRFTAYITLHDGWEWVSPDAMNSASRPRGRKNRLPVEWILEFGGSGSQSLTTVPIRRSDALDETLTSLRRLFATD
ncbi:hypothetical protein INS49_006414 [Diaporthe citri]|uniref:uncharacterized protein n=1 Tax=Diaporthe citri TaxID=83186 RepID=UPI001C816858|nr:uncharacterized protein INS49_006414 [Diaporthe citri]KAG6364810.1 hypothetical protein INS49_006414 [Diaporthe citri]